MIKYEHVDYSAYNAAQDNIGQLRGLAADYLRERNALVSQVESLTVEVERLKNERDLFALALARKTLQEDARAARLTGLIG